MSEERETRPKFDRLLGVAGGSVAPIIVSSSPLHASCGPKQDGGRACACLLACALLALAQPLLDLLALDSQRTKREGAWTGTGTKKILASSTWTLVLSLVGRPALESLDLFLPLALFLTSNRRPH